MISLKSDLAARLEAVFRRYADALDQPRATEPSPLQQFRKELNLLVAEYGQAAIDAALDEAGEEWPSVSLH
jgi:hypothetical protein